MGDTWHSCIHLPNTWVTLATHAPTFHAWVTLDAHAPTFLMYKRGVRNLIKRALSEWHQGNLTREKLIKEGITVERKYYSNQIEKINYCNHF